MNCYLKSENERYWTETKGFHGSSGCKLPREKMPDVCNTYDCKAYTFVFVKYWAVDHWETIVSTAVLGAVNLGAVEQWTKENAIL
jgi:hypothetical protein